MSAHPHQSEAHETLTKSPSAPRRPARRSSLLESVNKPSGSYDALRFQSDRDTASAIGSSRYSSSAALSRTLDEIPTPPYSEYTSSASGSGRSRKDSSETFASGNKRDLPQSSRLLEPPASSVTASPRSPSVASSSNNTGSDTVGGRSPLQPQDSVFASRRSEEPTASLKMTDSAMSPFTSTSSRSLSRIANAQREKYSDSPSQQSDHSPSASRAGSSLSTRSPGERRKRRSEMHERDVSQIRSESRLGFGNGDDDAPAEEIESRDQQHPFPRASQQHKYSPRKSTSLSIASSHYDDEESTPNDPNSPSRRVSLQGFDPNSPLTPTSVKSSRYGAAEDLPSGSMRRLSRTTRRASGRYSLDERTSPNPSSSSRSPMPAEFRLPDKEIRRAYRAAHQRDGSDSDGSEGREESASNARSSAPSDATAVRSPRSTHRDSLDEIREEGAKEQPTRPRAEHRRHRYASEVTPATDEVSTPLDYEGRLGTQGSRISIDSSSAQRHLSRNSLQNTPSSSTRRTPRSSEIGSPSEEARARKISSTSSGRSQKSSSSASELHRAASRVSMRKHHGSDLFSAEPHSATADASQHRPYSPPVRTEHSSSLTNSSGRSRPFYDQPRRVDDAALDNLRNQIEDMRVARGGSDHDRRQLPPLSMRNHAQLGAARSSLDLKSPNLGPVRAQSVMGIQRTPNEALRVQQMHQYPSTDPQRPRHDRSWQPPDPVNSSDAVNRIHELVSLRGAGGSQRQSVPPRSATVLGTASDTIVASPVVDARERKPHSDEEPAPIRNLAIRLSQYEALYSKGPNADSGTSAAAGPHTARMVELMGAIVRGTSTMWSELSSMHPIATEGHLMGRQGDAFTDAFGQLDEGLAFVNKLVLEQARAIQDLLFLLDRTEKERQAQFNQALVEMGHSPRPFSRMGPASGGDTKLAGASENAHLLRRATSSVRSGSSMQTDSPSPFTRASRGGTLTASQIRSMTSLGHTSNHGRSASELSPSSSAAQRRLDRVAQLPRAEASQDSPLATRRSVIGRPFPSADTNQAAFSGNSAAPARSAPSFTPRRPRLSNPSVSSATASFQAVTASAASSVFASSPENSLNNGVSGGEQMESEGSTIGGDHGAAGQQQETKVVEFGRRVSASDDGGGWIYAGDTVKGVSSRQSQRRSGEAATIRSPRIVDTLVSQLDTLRNGEGEVSAAANIGHYSSRRHTINNHNNTVEAEVDDPSRSPTKLSQYGLTKSPNPPPRPPRHVQRPSEEIIASLGRLSISDTRGGRNEPSTPTSSNVNGEVGTPRQIHHRSGAEEPGLGVRSLGRTAARRVSRVLGSQPQT